MARFVLLAIKAENCTVNDLKKISIQRKTKNGMVLDGTVRYDTIRCGYGDKFETTTVF